MRLSRSLFALLPLALSAPLAAQGFEGTFKQVQLMVNPQGVASLAGAELTDRQKILEALADKTKGADASLVQTSDITVSLKGGKMRLDGLNTGMGNGYAIMDGVAGMMYSVVPDQKQVIVLSAADAGAVSKALSERMGAPAASAPPTTTDLGVKQVAGVQAHGYRIATADGMAVVWVDPAIKISPLLSDFQQKVSGLNPGIGPLQAAMVGLGFPLSTQLLVKAPAMMGEGWLYIAGETSQVQKAPVADAIFTVPADFTQTNMKQMMGIN